MNEPYIDSKKEKEKKKKNIQFKFFGTRATLRNILKIYKNFSINY